MKTKHDQRLIDSKEIMRELILAPFLTGVAVMGGLTILVAIIAAVVVAVLRQ